MEIRALKHATFDSVATVLERDTKITIKNWLDAVEHDAELTVISLDNAERSAYVFNFLHDVILFRSESRLSTISVTARDHGQLRRQRGYTASMLVAESNILEMSIFGTLHKNLHRLNVSELLLDVIVIADEADSQPKQSMCATK
jgi:hypothetical protein